MFLKRKEILLAFLFFASISCVFFYKTFLFGQIPFPGDLLIAEYNPWKTYQYMGYNPGSFPNKAQYFDTLRQLYPWKTLAIDLVKNGQLPLWNPYNFSGAPLLANFQSAVFYPLNLLYILLPQIPAWTVLVVLQPFLACLFTYLFARKLGTSRLGSAFAGVSYGFSSFMTVWLEYNTIGHVILWFPLILLSVEHLVEKLSAGWSLVFVLSLTSALLAGHPQVATYLFVFTLAFALFRSAKVRKQKAFFGMLLLLFLLPVGLAAVQFVPGIELIQESARSPHAYDFLIDKILIQPWQLAMLFVPDFFGNPATRNYWPQDTYVGKVTSIGIIALPFVALALIRKRNEYTRFFQWAAAVVLLLASSNPITALLYKFELPIVSASSPTLAVFLFCFSLSVLAGFGVDLWRKESLTLGRLFMWLAPFLLVFSVFWIVMVIIGPPLSNGFRNMLLATALISLTVVLLALGNYKKTLTIGIVIFLLLLQTGDLWRSFTKFNPFVSSELVFPHAPILTVLQKKDVLDRFWGYGAAAIDANFATQYGLFSPDGYDPLYPGRYGEFIQSSKEGKIVSEFTRQTRSDAIIAPGYGEEDLAVNNSRLRVLDFLGVRFILDRPENASTEKTFPEQRFSLLTNENGWRVFENKKPMPRAFLVSDYRVFTTSKQFEELFFAPDFDASQTVLLEEDIGHRFEKLQEPSRADIIAYTTDGVTVSTSSESDALLVLSDTYYPGWEALIDSQAAKIYRANYAFRAVVVPKGEHAVRFVYRPQSFAFGATISSVALVIAIVFIAFMPKWKRYID